MSSSVMTLVGVIGTAAGTASEHQLAYEVGQRIASRGWVLVTGGLGGVMHQASRGASDAGGLVVGILPTPTREGMNPFISIPIVTNMGHARNVIIAHTAEALVAVGGAEGTLSEIAIGLKLGKLVVSLGSWDVHRDVRQAASPQEAINLVARWLGR